MPRSCTVCSHAGREAIDRALVTGEAVYALARRYSSLSEPALRRHKDAHLPATLAKAHDAAEAAHADDLLGQVRQLQGKALGILTKAEESGQLMVALGAIREARGCLELLGKLMGEIDDRPQVNVLVLPEWLGLRAVLLRALAPHPEARAALMAALEGTERAAG